VSPSALSARPLPRVVTSAVVAAFLLAACNGGSAPAGGPPGGAMPPMPVTLLTVQPVKVPVSVDVVATLEGLREVEVRARVAGTLQQQLYREGERVAAGAPLFRIERAPLEIAVDAARAAVAQAESRAEQARRESGRLATLVAERAISQREADDAGSSAKTADAAVLAARAQLREAQLNIGYTDVTSPIAGVAQRAQRSVGALVSPANDSGLLTTVVQVDPIRVRFALSESEAAQVRQGKGRQVRLMGADGQPAAAVGRLDFTGSVIDARLGTVQMRAEIANADRAWLPGQFVRAQVITGEQEAFLVPQAAVMSGDQGRFVWVMGSDGKAAAKPVEAGPWQGKDWVIRSGLVAGDKVIVDNLLKLRPGAPVQPAPPPGAAAGSAPGAAPGSAPGAAPGAAAASSSAAPASAASK
jgi:membrane fusion protein, multidrug efflux system